MPQQQATAYNKEILMNYNNVFFEAAYGTSRQLPQSDIPEIVFAGRSNVGKSSLLNKIFNRKQLARVSSTPGKTTTINFFRVSDVRFVDLPGYGFAKVDMREKQRWFELIDGYLKSGRNIKLVVQLIDMRHPPTADDITMLNFLVQIGLPFMIVLTKSDKLNKTERTKRLQALETELDFLDDYQLLPFSALKNEGVEDIREAIEYSLKI